MLITKDEAARRLCLSRGMIDKLIKQGRLASVKVGTSRRIDERDLETFVESRKVGGGECCA
jgi:excisionase family DNA binding protein